MTKDVSEFQAQVNESKSACNVDNMEGSLDALVQAVVCTKDIGWRHDSQHLIVLSTDAGYHVAGDGKLAGLAVPNDGLCHVESEGPYLGDDMDYPSISHLNQLIIENNKHVIFAIAGNTTDDTVYDIYKDLTNHLSTSYVAKLDATSDSVLSIIKDNYKVRIQLQDIYIQEKNGLF